MNQQPGPPDGPQGGGRPAPRPEDAGRALLAKSRDLLPVLRDKWGVAMQEGGAALQAQANRPDWAQDGRGLEQQNRFESSLEDFHSTIDQMELNLKCALETTGQSQSSQRYMPLPLLSYQQVHTYTEHLYLTSLINLMCAMYVPRHLFHNFDPRTVKLFFPSTLALLSSK